jgi:acetyl-CoA C-acetyltransferase
LFFVLRINTKNNLQISYERNLMSDVVIAGIGQVPVGEHWELSLRTLAARVIRAALKDSGGLTPQVMYIGNYLAPMVTRQANLGSLLVDNSGLKGIEAYTVEAAGASGAAAFHQAVLAIQSGFIDVALVVGVEKYNDMVGPGLEAAVAQSTDYDYEAVHGLIPMGQAALLMGRYLHEYGVARETLGEFSLLAHANAVNNPNAIFRKAISREAYARAELVADPLNLLDMAPYLDGAAAIVLARSEALPADFAHSRVRVSGSSVVVDALALHDRNNPLFFQSAAFSVERACGQAGILPGDVDFFELCDAFSIYAALSLEAAGFAKPGEACQMAAEGCFGLRGKLPICTLGGLKARGNPLGATGVYQLVEATQQLRGEAGANQLENPRRALVQSLGGPASTAVTQVLERVRG